MTTTTKANEAHDHPVQGKRTGPGGIAHTHELDDTGYATKAQLAALEGRVAALEGGTTPPEPEPEPEPVPPPTGLAYELDGTTIAGLLATYPNAGDPGYGLDSHFLGNLSQVVASAGAVRITAQRRTGLPSGRSYVSASFNAPHSQFRGAWEARIRYPGGQGVWPAFWLKQGSPSAAPPEQPPEIDVFEAYPAPPGAGGGSGANVLVQTLHYPGEPQSLYKAVDAGADLTAAFHVHRIEWTASYLRFLLDGVETFRVTTNLPTVPMFPIVTLAMGATGYRVDSSTPATLTMDVDYLRVWAP